MLNEELGDEHLIEVLDKWPDFLEVYQRGDDESTRRIVVIVQRRNSRQLQTDQTRLLQALEDSGVDVRVRVGTVDLTLEQFEKGGVFKARPTVSAPGSQAHNNARSTLKKLEELIQRVDKDDPRYIPLVKRIHHFREMLNSVEPEPIQTALMTSDQALKVLEELLPKRAKKLSDFTEEELGELSFAELGNLGVERFTPEWEKLVSRWNKARRGDNTDATKPGTASQSEVNPERDEQLTAVDSITPIIESD